MKYIGNILSNNKIDDDPLYNIVKSKEELIDGIPTLIIGWEKVNQIYSNVKILDWNIEKDVYWTFGKRERRNQMEKDIAKFKKLAMAKLSTSITYTFLNILTANNEIKGRLFSSLISSEEKIVYINNDMLYIYYSNSKKVLGISLRDIEYGKGNIKKLFSILYSNGAIRIIKDKEDVPFELRFSLKNSSYTIPYLYS